MGVGYLFSLLGGLIISPQFIRNLDEECMIAEFELETLKDKLKKKSEAPNAYMASLKMTRRVLSSSFKTDRDATVDVKPGNGFTQNHKNSDKKTQEDSEILGSMSPEFLKQYGHMIQVSPRSELLPEEDEESLKARIETSENELYALGTMGNPVVIRI